MILMMIAAELMFRAAQVESQSPFLHVAAGVREL